MLELLSDNHDERCTSITNTQALHATKYLVAPTLPFLDKIDFRNRGRPAQEALRTQAVYLVRRVGKTRAEAAEAVGVSRQVVNRARIGAIPRADANHGLCTDGPVTPRRAHRGDSAQRDLVPVRPARSSTIPIWPIGAWCRPRASRRGRA